MENKQVKKLINAALSAFLEEIDTHEAQNSNALADRLEMSYDDMIEAIDTIKRDYVLVPADDPGLRMVETEITL